MASVKNNLAASAVIFSSLGVLLGGSCLAFLFGKGWRPFSQLSAGQLKALRWTTGLGAAGAATAAVASFACFKLATPKMGEDELWEADKVDVEALIRGDVNARDPHSGQTALYFYLERKQWNEAAELMNREDFVLKTGDDPPIVCVNSVECVRELLRAGVSAERLGGQALMIAIEYDRPLVKELLEQGASATELSPHHYRGASPIQMAIKLEDLGSIQLLLNYGVGDSINEPSCMLADGSLVTPLKYSVSSMSCDETALVKLLLDHGADPDQVNHEGKRPIDYAVADVFGRPLDEVQALLKRYMKGSD